MIIMDEFFKQHYKSICNYCATFGFNFWDVEEMVVDVILKDYAKHRAENMEDRAIRSFMSRRVMLNLKANYRNQVRHTRTRSLTESDETLDYSDPADILCVTQRLPAVHPILINYEAHGGNVTAKGENTSADRTRFCRERKKFLNQLKGN